MRNIVDYIRISSVLSPFSGLNHIPKDVLTKAADRGTKVHAICDAIIEGVGLSCIEPELQGYIDSFNQWNYDKKFIEKPSRLFCDKHTITGEIDGIYKDKNGDLVLFDLKTPQKESKSWIYQASAYSYLCKENGYEICRLEFIQLSKTGKDAKIYHYEEDFKTFLECLKLYNIFFKNDKPEYYLDYL